MCFWCWFVFRYFDVAMVPCMVILLASRARVFGVAGFGLFGMILRWV